MANVLDDVKHIGTIADSMSEWGGAVADALELTYADRAAISEAHPGRVNLQKRMALMMWKQKKDSQATGENLARGFETAGCQQYAKNVRRICEESGGAQRSLGITAPPVGAANTSVVSPRSHSSNRSVNPSHLQLVKWKDRQGQTHRFYLMTEVEDKWRTIGQQLNFLPSQLNEIATQFRDNATECCRAVLGEWPENPSMIDYPATWEGLMELLEDCKLAQVAVNLKATLTEAKLL